MKISYNWMKEYGALSKVGPDGAPTAEEFAQKLDSAGYDVEGVTAVEAGEDGRSVADQVIDVRYPRSRRDLTCMMWNAKELCGIYGIFYHDFALYGLYVPTNDWMRDVTEETELHLVSTTRLCKMMCGRIANDAKAKPLPQWYRDRAIAQGVPMADDYEELQVFVGRNVGQPLWLFDLETLPSREICAQEATVAGTLVDGEVEYAYEPGDLVLVCGGKVISVAGVVVDDSVKPSEGTRSLVLFSGVMDPDEVRRVAARLEVHNFNEQLAALGANAADVLKTLTNSTGIICDHWGAGGFEALEIYNKFDMTRKFLTYTVEEVNELLDSDYTFEDIKAALDNPELNTYRIDDTRITTMFPSYRTDNHVCDIAQSLLTYMGCDRVGSVC